MTADLPRIIGDIEGGRLLPAQARLRALLGDRPDDLDALFLLGLVQQLRGLDTLPWNLRVLAIASGHSAAAANAAGALVERLQLARAFRLLRRALALDPAFAPALGNLGLALLREHTFVPAIRVLTRTLGLAGPDPLTLINLGAALEGGGSRAQAQWAYRIALAVAPDFARAVYNEAVLAQACGDIERALVLFRRTLAILPQDARVHSNLLFAMAYRADAGNRRRAAEAMRWAERHARLPVAPAIPADRDPGRRLRIGYLSSDLRDHPVARNVEGLIRHHDRSGFEIALYSVTPGADSTTERLKRRADLWRESVLADDAGIAEQIRRDRIDILVVLGAHTGDNRPRVAAFRPAPILVGAHDLGTTGMPEIGWWLTDAVLHPPDTGEPFVESLKRLPCFYLETPPAAAPEVAPRPAGREEILFVSANNPAKLSPATIAVWSRVLAAVPGARLKLKFVGAFADPATRRRHEAAFAAHGIGAERLDLAHGRREPAEHLAEIGEADIALDPWPFNGSTTSFEALWMGLPVVSLAGSCFVGRVGASLLNAAGLPELIAADEDAYVRIAAGLAADRARLAALRAGLRARVAASPLCDAERYTRSVEQAYREMWRNSCGAASS
jgi:predicted O-linked N-acetylglucosamine transferase (SPINDLY family)